MYRSHQFIKRRELNLIAAHSLGSGRLGIPEAAHHDSSCDNPGEASQGAFWEAGQFIPSWQLAQWLTLLVDIYATSEERRQRNRQAQNDFRERKTEYIKQLETTIKYHKEQLELPAGAHLIGERCCPHLLCVSTLIVKSQTSTFKQNSVRTEALMWDRPKHLLPKPAKHRRCNEP
jgi:hypothetical protein